MGINNVDLAAARAQGVVVTNTPGANSASVAELTIGLLLNLLRPIQQAASETRLEWLAAPNELSRWWAKRSDW
ncbi:hypothetical protein [Candidatus Amarobacter glycogenicus]|uniref:hypothetical protein n=1 Tax=Candidatus Amarobacter glycogenicus TaxID=3140699 RepID=UPI002A10BBE6|nr:hypothetical protein [Dehalococcoidia bacterium]